MMQLHLVAMLNVIVLITFNKKYSKQIVEYTKYIKSHRIYLFEILQKNIFSFTVDILQFYL